MKTYFFCPRWGSEQIEWGPFFEKVKMAGYDGIELGIAAGSTTEELDMVWNPAAKYHLMLIAQHYDTVTVDFNLHLESYHHWLEKIKPYPFYKINSQTGKDFFSFEQNQKLIEMGCAYNALHEIHRGKFFFAAHFTQQNLENITEFNFEVMQFAMQRTEHVHTRIGFQEGLRFLIPGQLTGQKC